MLGQSRAKCPQVSGQGWIVDQGKFASQMLGHRIAQIDLLLVAKNVLPGTPAERRRLRTTLLRRRAQCKKQR